MSTNKHPKTHEPNDLDLKGNPGIGTSKGATNARDPDDEVDGENTFAGDVENDVRPDGSVDPNQLGRTNK